MTQLTEEIPEDHRIALEVEGLHADGADALVDLGMGLAGLGDAGEIALDVG